MTFKKLSRKYRILYDTLPNDFPFRSYILNIISNYVNRWHDIGFDRNEKYIFKLVSSIDNITNNLSEFKNIELYNSIIHKGMVIEKYDEWREIIYKFTNNEFANCFSLTGSKLKSFSYELQKLAIEHI